MPSWSSRLLSNPGSSSSSASRNPRNSSPDKDLSQPPRAPYAGFPGPPSQHGPSTHQPRPGQAPALDVPAAPGSPRSRPHARSVSDKIPAFLGGVKKKLASSPPESDLKSVPLIDDFMADETIPGQPRNDDRDQQTGHCATCDSKVKWPRGVMEFRCTNCLMINDLRQRQRLGFFSRDPAPSNVLRAETFPRPNSASGFLERTAVESLTVDRTLETLQSCIDSYTSILQSCLDHAQQLSTSTPPESPQDRKSSPTRNGNAFSPRSAGPKLNGNSQHYPTTPPDDLSPSPFTQINGSRSPSHSVTSHVHDDGSRLMGKRSGTHVGDAHNTRKPLPQSAQALPAPPTRRPPPPPPPLNTQQPSGSHDRNSPTFSPPRRRPSSRAGSSFQASSHLSTVPLSRIFKPLEDLIEHSFGDFECLNASFLKARPSCHGTFHSDDDVHARRALSPPKTKLGPDESLSELDAKTLLLGDVAENGMWWTGRDQRSMSVGKRRRPSERSKDPQRSLVHSKTPQIDWHELDRWYGLIMNVGKETSVQLRERLQEMQDISPGRADLNELERQTSEASLHVQKTLLRASESLLKRPGRPLREPSSARFLLILLANPLLYPLDSPKRRYEHESSTSGLSLTESHGSRVLNGTRPNAWEEGNAFGIIKRVLGLLANLPNDCHRILVAWFSRYDEDRFREMVDLLERFLVYRLKRQHGRKKRNTHNPADGLIPSLSGTNADTSAQLHAALGFSGQGKTSPDMRNEHSSYVDDWQTRATARVLSLLFTANKTFHGERSVKSLAADAAMSKTGSLSRNHIKNHGQPMSTTEFYNTMVDFCDLIADFDMWESSPGKFAFCQYPFLLSVGAKIRIMEHDARRQMEVKAREAFFDSLLKNKALEQYLVLKVRRDCLVEDSLNGISEVVGTGQEEIKKGLRVQFVGEEGVDAGGLRKEWFLSLVREIFDPQHALFVYDEESRFCYFNPNSFETSDRFFLVGALLGLAIYNSTILDVALPPFTFKKLLTSPNPGVNTSSKSHSHAQPFSYTRSTPLQYTIEDLAEYRPSLARGLRQMLDYPGNVQETYCRDFVIEVERYGTVQEVPLCTNGAHRPVTNANRQEFVDLYIRYLLDTSVARQFEPFKRGFFTVCGGNALSLFQPEEIELLVRGSDEPLDVPSLKAVAAYENWHVTAPPAGESPGSKTGKSQRREIVHPVEQIPLLRWFWEEFETAQAQNQRKLLSFITGSDRIPAVGASSLVIKITFAGKDHGRFPVARTCFNMLMLFKYRSREELARKLWRAVEEGEGFGLK